MKNILKLSISLVVLATTLLHYSNAYAYNGALSECKAAAAIKCLKLHHNDTVPYSSPRLSSVAAADSDWGGTAFTMNVTLDGKPYCDGLRCSASISFNSWESQTSCDQSGSAHSYLCTLSN